MRMERWPRQMVSPKKCFAGLLDCHDDFFSAAVASYFGG